MKQVTDVAPASMSHRVSTVLSPYTHNPCSEWLYTYKKDSTSYRFSRPPPEEGSASVETRLTFCSTVENGALWTLSGVVGPAAKVLDYARGH